MYLSRSQILDSLDRKFEDVQVPEWGGTVRVGSFSALDRGAFEQSVYTEGKQVDMAAYRVRLCAATIVDEDGKTLFTQEDVEALCAKSAAALDRVFTAAAKLNGLMPSNEKAIEGNSDAAPGGSSSSD